ncbi:PRC-barrel domain-containing protein [Marinococcus halophilus]|uniref:PRC-barrel domain-containing protein n=1 Tax=Marinococcus halophilus TaxID=1371 RepID=UPI0009A6CA13|nr:PRC-barrel domain-containing protein [Marinococcus halophilus]
MLVRTKDFQAFWISATNEEAVGTVSDVYFDSRGEWKVRFIVADTRTWFVGGKVLLSPKLIDRMDLAGQAIQMNASKDQIKDSPKPDEHEPISRSYESSVLNYYNLEPYWIPTAGSTGTGPAMPVGGPFAPTDDDDNNARPARDTAVTGAEENEMEAARNKEDYYLQSTKDLRGYDVDVSGENIGTISDVVFDTNDWSVQFIEIDTAGALSSDHSLVPVERFNQFSAIDESATASVSREAVERSPDYESSMTLTDDYGEEIRRHFGSPSNR